MIEWKTLYDRQVFDQGLSLDQQKHLMKARVAVFGAGGLGVPLLTSRTGGRRRPSP